MFTVGQKVVALKSYPEEGVYEGQIRVVQATYFCCRQHIDIGVPLGDCDAAGCFKCSEIFIGTNTLFPSFRFAPLEDIEAMNEFFNKIIEPETIEV